MIEGPAVDDVEANFRQRWNAHPNSVLGGRTPVPARPPAELIDPIPDASHFVQINRNMPQGVPSFSFLNPEHGDPGARQARVNAIRQARRYVYIEEQYLTMVDSANTRRCSQAPRHSLVASDPDTIAAALRERIDQFNPPDFVAILIPRRLGKSHGSRTGYSTKCASGSSRSSRMD